MTKYLLTDFELNGYDDSDFIAGYFDTEICEIEFTCYGSTRYPSASMIGFSGNSQTSTVSINGEPLLFPTTEVVEQARQALEEHIFLRMTAEEKRRVEEPDEPHMQVGLRVRLIASARMQVREQRPCGKCKGSGKWQNPRNLSDQRECFSCKGTGQWTGDKVKSENGKQAWKVLPAGLAGTVVSHRSHGTFYANGYNKRDRSNTSVEFKTDNGEVVRAGLAKLRLDRECDSSDNLRKQAKDLSFGYQFSALYRRWAWDTRNYAAEVISTHSSKSY